MSLALVLPYIGSQSTSFDRTIRRITEKVYYSVKPRVILKSYPMLTPRGKDLITNKNSISVVYTFQCFCERNYIRQTSRYVRRIKDPKSVENFILNPVVLKITAIKNAMNIYLVIYLVQLFQNI